ncbi:hypothetical protein D3C76_1859400 [compost metagenome]
MPFGVQAVRILKMGMRKSEQLGFLVHQINEALFRSANVLGYGGGRIVARTEHQPV